MTIVEIEYYKGDTLLYGRKINESELKSQIREIESCYDRDIGKLYYKRIGW